MLQPGGEKGESVFAVLGKRDTDIDMNRAQGKTETGATRLAATVVERHGLWTVLVLAFAARIFMAWNRDMFSPDSALYIAAAYHYARGETARALAIYPLPTLSLLLAVSHGLVGSWKMAAIPFTIVPSALVSVPVYRMSDDLFGKRAAFWSGCALALDPYLVKYGVQILRDPMFLCLFVWGVEGAYRFLKRPQWPYFVRAAILVGSSLLFRIDGLFFIPLWTLLLVIRAITCERGECGRYRLSAYIWAGMPLVALSAAALLFPSQWMDLTQGSFISARIRDLVSLRFLDGYREIYHALKTFNDAGSPLTSGLFLDAVRHYLPLLYFIVLIEYYVRILFPSNALLFVAGIRLRRDWGQALLIAAALSFMAVTYLFIVQESWIAKRYLSLVVPLLLPWVGNGMVRLGAALDRGRISKLLYVLLVALFVGWPALKIVSLAYQKKDPTLRLAGQWLAAQHRYDRAKVFAADNRILLYSGRYDDIPAWKQHEGWKNRLRERTGSRKRILVVIDTDTAKGSDLPRDLDAFRPIKVFQGPVYRVTVMARDGDRKG